MTLIGIDISYAQATTPPLAAYSFVICRASFAGKVDSRWAFHSANVRAAGKPLGAYHYWLQAAETVPIADQVAVFLATAADADFLALDLEGLNANTVGLNESRDFIARVHAAGRQIGLYHSLSGYPDLGQDWNWPAFWGSAEPTIPHAIWQYSDGAGLLDHDRFNGDDAAFAAFLATQGGTSMGLTLSLPDVPLAGLASLPVGIDILKVADATKHAVRTLVPSAPAYGATLQSGGAAAGGYLVEVNGEAFFAHRADVTFTAASASAAELDAARAAGYAAAKAAAAKAVTAI